MFTQGYYIGKIVDDLVYLKTIIETYNKRGLFDINKYSEDFICRLLNTLYGYNLINLNRNSPNEPGLDLGDDIEKIAFQVTSDKTSKKINNTLQKITAEQEQKYKTIKIILLGNKQNSYTIDSRLASKFKFRWEQNILDIDDLLRDIVIAEPANIESIYNQFRLEFRKFILDFEPVDVNGDYMGSISSTMEVLPNTPPKNAGKMKAWFTNDENEVFNMETIKNLYNRLSRIPRFTREILWAIVERGEEKKFNDLFNDEFGILPYSLMRLLKMDKEEFFFEIEVLLDKNLVYYGDREVNEKFSKFIVIGDDNLTTLIRWCSKNKLSFKQLLNTMDWTKLDEQEV